MLETLIPYMLGSAAVGSVIGWVAHSLSDSDGNDTVYDTAGNVFSSELLPDPHVDLVVNTISPLGFVAAQLRLSGDYAKDRSIIDDAGRALDAAVEGLKADLTPCVDCGQINGNHLAKCASVAEMLTMNWVGKEPKKTEEIEDASS